MAGMLAAYHPHDCSGNQLGSGPRIAMSLTTTSTSSTTPTTSPPQLERRTLIKCDENQRSPLKLNSTSQDFLMLIQSQSDLMLKHPLSQI